LAKKIGDILKGEGIVTQGEHYRLRYSPPKDPSQPYGASYVIDRRSGKVYQHSPGHKHFSSSKPKKH